MPVGINYARYSSQLTNPLWQRYCVTPVDLGLDTTSPTGRTTRIIVTNSLTGGWGFGEALIPEYQPNTQFTAAVWLKQESLSVGPISLNVRDSLGNGVITSINLSSWAASTAVTMNSPTWSSYAKGANVLSNGWHQLWVQGTSGPTQGLTLSVEIMGPQAPLGNSFLCGGFTVYQGNNIAFVETSNGPLGSQFLPVFPTLYHRVATDYPENSTAIKFGNGYSFASPPRGPVQRTFNLEFDGLRFFQNDDGSVDTLSFPQFNAGALEAFYQLAQLYQPFVYNHPSYGNLRCRFGKPLKIPRPEAGGQAVIKALQVELIEMPT